MVAAATLMQVLSVAGTVVSVIGQISSANAASNEAQFNADQAMYNAGIADINAQREIEAAELEESMQRDRLRRTVGSQNVARAKSGITQTGSSLFVQDDTIIQGELDALIIRNKGQLAANNYRSQGQIFRTQASQYKQQAKNAKTAGLLSAGATILGGVGNYRAVGGKLPGMSPAGTNPGGGRSIPIDYSGYKSPF